jgi:hypothetical protein
MAEITCPSCGKPNPSDRDKCRFCAAELNPDPTSTADGKTGKRRTAEFAGGKLDLGDLSPAGGTSTGKNQEPAEEKLPSWLLPRAEKTRPEESRPAPEGSQASRQPDGPISDLGADSTTDLPEWLAGLGKTASDEEEEMPDWLMSLRSIEDDSPTPGSALTRDPTLNQTGSLSAGPDGNEWMARLNLGTQPARQEGAAPEPKPDPSAEGGLSSPPAPAKAPEETRPASKKGDEIPDWMDQLKERAIESVLAPREDSSDTTRTDIPDWLSNFGSKPGTPEAATGESMPDWLSHLEVKSGPAKKGTGPLYISEKPPESPAPDSTSDWLSQFKADVNDAARQEATDEQFEPATRPSAKKGGSGSLPDWLAGITPSQTPSNGTPALITSEEGDIEEDKSSAAFSMEVPEWLSRLKPEQAFEKPVEKEAEPAVPGDLEVSELPSWIQAMRPVESIVADAKVNLHDGPQVTEQNGPLAGLKGVLPVGPGLGALSKPPAYSNTLQVTEGQQRYAAAFEELISSESLPLEAKRTRLTSSRLLRWLITGLMVVAVGLPLSTGISVTHASTLQRPEMVSAFSTIGSLPPNTPVLVVFDYDPALAGEMEAAAAPLLDHLLLQGPRLALISSNPTGPALAERLLQDLNASPLVARHAYLAGQQYVNLGYLAGGSSGVKYFAMSPTKAAPFALDGQPAWQQAALQGIQSLGDFATIIILSDNADSGRVWIEQAGTTNSNTPMLMVISAQAEPMILPYYDSGQIKGLVTGLAGGEAYEQTFLGPEEQTGLAQRYWNAFSTGTLVAELSILAGALWSVVAALRARSNKLGKGT